MSSLSINKVRNRALNANAQNTNNYSMWLEPLSHKQYPVTDVHNATTNALITSNGTRNTIIAQPGITYNNVRLDISGSVNPTKWTTGQTINTVFLQPADISQNQAIYSVTNSPHIIARYSYTPKSNNSKIIVEYDALYIMNGFNDDVFQSRLLEGENIIGKREQHFINENGGGTRSGCIFPINGVFTNNALTPRVINVQLIITSSSDTVTMYGAYYDASMKITEIAA